jgi:hypothetical protein
MSPDEMGGAPAAMPTNDWWKVAGQALDVVRDIGLARQERQLLTQRRDIPASGGYQSSNVRNFPPNAGGQNPQAGSVPGAPLPGSVALSEFIRTLNPVVILAVAAVVAVLFVQFVRRA